VTASSSRSKAADLAPALAVAVLGLAALAVPELLVHYGPPCILSPLLGDLCWGCGITRASIALFHGDVAAAWHFNKLSVVVVPMLLFLYLKHLFTLWRRYAPARFQQV
jgi:hypothetical protein